MFLYAGACRGKHSEVSFDCQRVWGERTYENPLAGDLSNLSAFKVDRDEVAVFYP